MFFTKDDFKHKTASEFSIPLCGKCGFYKYCNTPKMSPVGKGKKKILILTEHPTNTEDITGKLLSGEGGAQIHSILNSLNINLKRDCWVSSALICHPNKKVTEKEIEYCRPNFLTTLKVLQPVVIIPMGKLAIECIIRYVWKDEKTDSIDKWVGWKIPSQKINTWICPTFSPEFLLENPNPAKTLAVTKHFKQARDIIGKPWKVIPDYNKDVIVSYSSDDVGKTIKGMMESERPLAFDYETDRLKPDSKESQIICCSVSDGKKSVAYPWDKRTAMITQQLLKSDIPKIGANIKFEERWTKRIFGHGVKNWKWDTVLAAHWLDCRSGVTSVKFQSFVRLGCEDYDSDIKPFLQADGTNKPNRIKELPIDKLLTYCALDSLLEYKIAESQWWESGYSLLSECQKWEKV